MAKKRQFHKSLIELAELRVEKGESYAAILALMNPGPVDASAAHDRGRETNGEPVPASHI